MNGRSDDRHFFMSGEDPADLRALAAQCRSLARGASTGEVAESLNEIAAGYEHAADKAEAAEPIERPAPLVSDDGR